MKKMIPKTRKSKGRGRGRGETFSPPLRSLSPHFSLSPEKHASFETFLASLSPFFPRRSFPSFLFHELLTEPRNGSSPASSGREQQCGASGGRRAAAEERRRRRCHKRRAADDDDDDASSSPPLAPPPAGGQCAPRGLFRLASEEDPTR